MPPSLFPFWGRQLIATSWARLLTRAGLVEPGNQTPAAVVNLHSRRMPLLLRHHLWPLTDTSEGNNLEFEWRMWKCFYRKHDTRCQWYPSLNISRNTHLQLTVLFLKYPIYHWVLFIFPLKLFKKFLHLDEIPHPGGSVVQLQVIPCTS